MLGAVRTTLGDDWKEIRAFARPELRRLARVLVDIGRLAVAGKISQAEARSLVRIHKNTTEMILLTGKGLGILAVENAVNAATGSVRDAVNKAVGFVLV
jgi:hypothetical protein